MKSAKKVATVVLSVVLWAIILIAALFAFTTLATRDSNNLGNIGGLTPLVVQSDSMKPTFSKGDLIVIKTCDPDKLAEGDIVTFHTVIDNKYALNTHKIVKIEEENGVRTYTTKGDANSMEDTSFVTNGDIVGKYSFKLPKMGHVMNFLSTSVGFLCVIVLPMLLFFIYQVYHLVMVGIKLKKAAAIEQAEEIANVQSGDEAAAKLAEAEAALAEAKRLKEEAEAKLAAVENGQTEEKETEENKDDEE